MKRFAGFLAITLFVLIGVAPLSAQEYTSVKMLEEDPILIRDYNLQGIYEVIIGGKPQLDVNFVADGGGKFRIAARKLEGDGLKGEIFGKGKMLDDDTLEVTLDKAVDATGLEIEPPDYLRVWKGAITRTPACEQDCPLKANGPLISIELTNEDEPMTATFKKVYRSSPTLGAKAPEGAAVIFDGTDLEKFRRGAKMNEESKTLWAEATAKAFEDKPYTMHIEFMLSYMPQAKGQARSNSGVYINQNYECQVLDSFGLDGKWDECGGFYRVAKPLVNMCYPPLTWQTYDIDFVPAKYNGEDKTENARITVKHNGVLIHDNVEMKEATPGCMPEGPGPKGLYLQGHGNKVQYRNIWVDYKD